MKSLVEIAFEKRQIEQVQNTRLKGRDAARDNYWYSLAPPLQKIGKKPCRWCGKLLIEHAKTCRKCHTTTRPCADCGGPVGRDAYDRRNRVKRMADHEISALICRECRKGGI